MRARRVLAHEAGMLGEGKVHWEGKVGSGRALQRMAWLGDAGDAWAGTNGWRVSSAGVGFKSGKKN